MRGRCVGERMRRGLVCGLKRVEEEAAVEGGGRRVWREVSSADMEVEAEVERSLRRLVDASSNRLCRVSQVGDSMRNSVRKPMIHGRPACVASGIRY